jgi:hypothetical protein
MHVRTIAAIVVTASAVPAQGWAQGQSKFGSQGQLAISSDLEVSFEGNSYSNKHGSGSTILLQPAADYFVIDSLSVGGQILFELDTPAEGPGQTVTQTTTFGLAPRVGYNIPLTDNISFWPDVFVGFRTSSYSNNGGSGSGFTIGAFAPLLFHPVPHFFIGLGPNVSTQLSNSYSPPNGPGQDLPKLTQYGVMSTLGGWFSLGGG